MSTSGHTAYFRLNADHRAVEGVISGPRGEPDTIVSDLDKFADSCSKLSITPPPYTAFVRRKKPTLKPRVDWETLLSGTPLSLREGEGETVLRNTQVNCVRHVIEELDGKALVAMDPGMGKTLTAILLAKHYGGRRLFIVPKGLAPQWAKEITRVLGSASLGHDVEIVSYDRARISFSELCETKWNFVCVDESTVLRSESKRSKCIRGLMMRTEARILLSGTPQLGSPADLFNQLQVLHPGYFRDRAVFEQRYTNGFLDAFGRWVVQSAVGGAAAEELHLLLDAAMFRATAAEQKGLPKRRRFVMPMIAGGSDAIELHALQNALRLAKRRGGADILRATNDVRRVAGEIKARMCRKWLKAFMAEQAPHEKYVFFVEHVKTGQLVANIITELGHESATINASVSPSERAEIVTKIADPGHPLRFLIASYRTCSMGITLCPGARFIFFLDIAYMHGEMEQAEKRVNREGAVEDAMLYWLMLSGSTDDKIVRKLQARYKDSCMAVDGKQGQKIDFTFLPPVR